MASKQDKQLQEITRKLEEGVKEMLTSENYTEYLKVMSQFHDYSFNNTMLIAMQKPEATLVAGYQAWQKKFERHVKKGEKGIQIIAPAPIREKEEVEKIDPVTNEPVLKENGQPETEIITHVIPRFRVATVFDVSQTDGKPLPEFAVEDLTASVENYEAFMKAITDVSPVPIRFDEIEGEAHGYYHLVDKEIVIQEGMSEGQTMKTAIHEVSHAKLHDREIMEELGVRKEKLTREVEAESIAYCVCQYFGLDTSEYSFPYIGSWSSGKDMKELRASMDTIRKTAGEFIDSMTEALQQLMREQQEKEHPEQAEEYQQAEFYDVPSLFSNGRVDRESLPEGIFCYELRGADYDPGHPLTVEEHVTVNHAATILTAVPVTIPEQESLRLGDGLNFTGGEQTIPEYLQEMAVRNMEADKGIVESAIGRNNENLYLSGTEERYAIYQITDHSKGREYQFMGLDFVTSHDMAVDAADYAFIYGGRLSGEETLDSLYEKFNLNHPAGYEGHSLSVSDVVVMQRDGQTKAYYVDSFGFKELPDFIRQRLHEAEMNRKREDSAVTLDTSGIEIEQHEGLWHTADKREIADEIFYLMEHNEYGDSVAAVIVNADGELVAQELENGFDRGAMEAIHEYLAGKGIAWEPEAKETEASEKKSYPPVYRNTLAYAAEHGAADEYLDSRKLNIDCKRAVEEAIRSHFDGMHLGHDVVDGVLEEYGTERLSFVLACTVQYKETDGRFSRDTKEWAKSIPIPENMGRGIDLNYDYVVESHPAVLDGFIGLAREKFAELEKEMEEPFISQYYVVNDAYGVNAEREYQYFPDLDSALTAYAMLPNHLEKEIGMESTEQPPTRMSLIKCRNGLEALEDIEGASLSGKWVNPESREALRTAEMYLDNHDTEIAYRLESAGRYFMIQTVSEGYDYTFYDNQFRELDGGVYDNPDVTLAEAMEDILGDEGLSVADCKVMDFEELQEKVGEAEQEKNRKPLTAESVTDLKGKSHEYHAGDREAVYEFDCMVDGRPAVLTYTTGQREHFYSPLYDRGKIEDVFSIHTDGEDIWDRMPQAELEKLERLLAGEAEAFPIEERIAKAGSIPDLKEIDYYMMDMERTAMTEVHRKRIWDGLDRKGAAILQKAIDNAGNGEELQSVRELLTEAQGILYEEQYANLNEAARKRETELAAAKAMPLISDMTEPEKSLNGQSHAEIEEMVLCYAQAQIDGMGLTDEVKLLGARVYGSRTREGLYQEGSDVDVVLSYTGNIREDAFFNALHEDGMEIAGLPLDINPISTEKTGTLEEFIKNAEKYLDMKEVQNLTSDIVEFEMNYEQDMDMLECWDGEAEIEENPIYQVFEIIGNAIKRKDTDKFTEHLMKVIETHGSEEPIVKAAEDLLGRITGSAVIVLPEPKISFYVAECMEYPVMGEYHENLTLQEAYELYEKIPPEHINGVKGIGFRLEDGSIYDGLFELISGGTVIKDVINEIPHYKESPLVQKAIADLEKILSENREKEVVPEAEKQQIEQSEKPSIVKDKAGMEASSETVLMPEQTPETHSTVSEGTGRKQSVLKALRERQAKLKSQEQKGTEQKSQERKKGEQEL